MDYNFPSSSLDLTFQLIFVIAIIVAAAYNIYRRRHRAIELPSTSVLLTYYTEGANLLPLNKGNIGNISYSAIAITNNKQTVPDGEDGLLYMIKLPFKSKLHLVAITRHSGATQLDPAVRGSIMEKVVLEGNYNKYFSLYCEKGMQTEARYVLDPKAMLFTVYFCQSHNWEIIENELYFVQANGTKSDDDPTFMFEDVKKFVDEIRPALVKPEDRVEIIHDPNNAAIILSKYKCPICKSNLQTEDEFYKCPKHHGILLIGYNLPLIKSGKIANPFNDPTNKAEHSEIKCPVCESPMEHVPYAGSTTIIDSCTKCPYRWVDAGELAPKTPVPA